MRIVDNLGHTYKTTNKVVMANISSTEDEWVVPCYVVEETDKYGTKTYRRIPQPDVVEIITEWGNHYKLVK